MTDHRLILFNYGPDRPVAQGVAIDLPTLRNRTQQPTVLDAGCGHPGIDPVLDPDRDGDGADEPANSAGFQSSAGKRC